MSRARFAVHVSVVLALVAFVSWPEQRRPGASPFWGSGLVLTAEPTTAGGDPRFPTGPMDGRLGQIGFGTVSYVSAPVAPGIPSLEQKLSENVYEKRRTLLSRELLELGARINAIVGHTRTSANEAIPFAHVWLRNVRTGEIEARAVADQGGQFLFLDIRPTGYVVELIGSEGKVLAASALFTIGTGDVHRTTLFVPVGGPIRTLLAATGGASQVINTAVDAGVSRAGQPERGVSPQR